MERDFKNYERIIKSLAYKFAPSMKNDDIEDLIQEGYVLYLELIEIEKREGTECSFESALYTHIKQNWLNKLAKARAQKRKAVVLNIEELAISMLENKRLGRELLNYVSENPFVNFDTYLSLSKDTQDVVRAIITCPLPLKEKLKYGYGFQSSLNYYLKKRLGWSNKKIKSLWIDFAT